MKHKLRNHGGPKRQPMQTIKKEEFLTALESHLGIVSTACREAGIGKTTYYRWIEKDPQFKAKVDAVADTAIDFVETQLFKQIKDGNAQAAIFYLRTKAKHRGYSEMPMLGIDMSQPIQILLPGAYAQQPPMLDITPTDVEDEEDEEEEYRL